MRALFTTIIDLVIRDQEKVILFCVYPATELLIHGALNLLNIPFILYSSQMKPDEADRAVQQFNDNTESDFIFITSFNKGGYGMNLQHKCNHVLMMKPPPSEAAAVQAAGRARRMGSPYKVVYVYEFFLMDSFNSKQMDRNMKKALPSLVAELNRHMFSGANGEYYEEEGDLDLGVWCILDGKLVSGTDPRASSSKPVEPEQLLTFMMGKMKGARYQMPDIHTGEAFDNA